MNTKFSCQLELNLLNEKINESKSFEVTLKSDNSESELAQCEQRVKLVESYLKRHGVRYRKTVTHEYFDEIDSKASNIKEVIDVRFLNSSFVK